MTKSKTGTIKRVLVALRSRADAEISGRTAAILARAFDAKIRGVFFEDARHLDLAHIPSAIVVAPGGSPVQSFSKSQMRKAQEEEVLLCRRTLAGKGGAETISCEVVRIPAETTRHLVSEADSGDIILLNRSEVTENLEEFLKSGRSMASAGAGLVMISTQLAPEPGPIIVIDDGDDAALEAVRIGAKIAEASGRSLEIYVVGDGEQKQAAIKARALASLHDFDNVGFTVFDSDEKEWLLSRLSATHPDMVLADIEGPLLVEDAFASRVMRAARAPLFVLGHKKTN